MRQQLISILSCPRCKSSLCLKVNRRTKERIHGGKLACKKCDAIFPIMNDIICFNKLSLREATPQKIKKVFSLFMKQELKKKWIAHFTKSELRALKNEWRQLIDHFPLKRNTWHLDWATGTGRFLRNIIGLTRGETEIIALEKDYLTCVGLRYFLKKIRKYERISVICADARRMPFKKDVFDSVTSWHGLDEPKIEKAINESRRVLKNGAVFAASGIHYRKNSKSFAIARKEHIPFVEKRIIMGALRKVGFKKAEHKTFFKGVWNKKRSYLPVYGDFYSTYAIRAKK